MPSRGGKYCWRPRDCGFSALCGPSVKDAYIRDHTGRIVGRIDGSRLRDGTGKLVARYDKWANRTRDRNGKIVGNGDQRLRLLSEVKRPERN